MEWRCNKRRKPQLKNCYHPTSSWLRPCQCLYEICQLGWRSQGVASWTANSKIAHCHREKVNWAGVVCSFPTLFKKRHGRDEQRGKKRTTHCLWVELVMTGWHTEADGGRATSQRRGSNSQRGQQQNQSENPNSSLFATLPFVSFSHSLFLFPPCSHCFRGREETDKDRALNSDTGKHFFTFFSSSFSVVSPYYQLYTQFTLCVGLAGVIYMSVMSLVLVVLHDLLMSTLIYL